MGKSRAFVALCLALLLLVAGASAASAEVGTNVQGRDIAGLGDSLFLALTDPNGSSLNKLPKGGGNVTNVESMTNIGDLVSANDAVYYLRYDPPAYQVVASDEDGKLTPLVQFEGQEVSHLSYYNETLWCLVDGVLTLIDPVSGDTDALNPDVLMREYVINSDVIYYVSADANDQVSYSIEVEGEEIMGSWGTLWSMSIVGGNAEPAFAEGVSDLRAYGNYIYFHNMKDNYPTKSSDGALGMEGKLYRLRMSDNQPASMGLSYDWDYYVTPYGVVVFTQQNVSLYPLEGGTAKKLMEPEDWAMLTANGSNAYVYEYKKGKLTEIPLAGGANKVLYNGGPIENKVPESTRDIEYEVDDNGEPVLDDDGNPVPIDDTADTGSSTSGSSNSGSSSSSGKTGGYIFPNSKTKKLTRSQILDVSKSKWGYGRNEILARHGYQFKTKKYRDYFSGKSWYKAGGYSASKMTKLEWANMNLIRELEIEYGLLDEDGRPTDSGSGSSGGTNTTSGHSGDIFKNSSKTKLKKSQVSGLSASKLATARNEILARHGYPFTTSKWKNYFGKKSWYKKRSSFSYSDLNSIEMYNIELIKKYE